MTEIPAYEPDEAPVLRFALATPFSTIHIGLGLLVEKRGPFGLH